MHHALHQSQPETLSVLVSGFCVALTVAAIIAIGWYIARRARARERLLSSPPDPSWLHRPQPGEIWWADVPFQDGSGSKVRPCLVVRTYADVVDVLKITSQDRSSRSDHVEIDTLSWDPKAVRNSYLDLAAPFRLFDSALVRKAGLADEQTWRTACRRHSCGWSQHGW